jgi:hypothetical protein
MPKRKVTGRMNLYIRYEPNFFDKLRPAHDTAADAVGEMTEKEVSTLKSMIARYIERCHKKHGNLNLQNAVNRGQYS